MCANVTQVDLFAHITLFGTGQGLVKNKNLIFQKFIESSMCTFSSAFQFLYRN